jgi:hypothetical protein
MIILLPSRLFHNHHFLLVLNFIVKIDHLSYRGAGILIKQLYNRYFTAN